MTAISVKARRSVGRNTKWRIFFDHIVDSRGNEVRDYLVIEPLVRNDEGITGVCVLPVVEGRFALVSTYRHALSKRIWEAPKGFIDENETPEAAALRELTEETGLDCSATDLRPLGHVAPEASTMTARGALFAAECRVGLRGPDTAEIGLETVHFFDAAEMAAMAADGRIEDAATLVAYYRLVALQAR